jgi:hypothetical protein
MLFEVAQAGCRIDFLAFKVKLTSHALRMRANGTRSHGKQVRYFFGSKTIFDHFGNSDLSG